MATLREFILEQSTLPTGNTVREHIKHPKVFSGCCIVTGFDIEVDDEGFDVDIEAGPEAGVLVQEFIIEVCND